jgi:hypothetical protein
MKLWFWLFSSNWSSERPAHEALILDILIKLKHIRHLIRPDLLCLVWRFSIYLKISGFTPSLNFGFVFSFSTVKLNHDTHFLFSWPLKPIFQFDNGKKICRNMSYFCVNWVAMVSGGMNFALAEWPFRCDFLGCWCRGIYFFFNARLVKLLIFGWCWEKASINGDGGNRLIFVGIYIFWG